VFSCTQPKEESLTVEEGVSWTLAQFRKQQIADVHYDLSFAIPKALKDSIPAHLTLNLFISDISQALILDFMPNHVYPITVIVNEQPLEIVVEKEHVTIPSSLLVEGENRIDIDFIAGERSLNRNEEYLFTLLVPDRARTLFPCFDQPDIKATYNLHLTVPENWDAMTGASIENEETHEGYKTIHFNKTDKLSTYLFSFVAGDFEIARNEDTSFPMQLFHREKDEDKIRLSVPELFNQHNASVEFLENYTERKFPFEKLDFAAIYSHPYGGMEHVGAIQYLQQSLFLDSTATQSQELSRTKLIAHETAHMWFGDLVTMRWFNDVWMKEVFANFMADKIANPIFPDINHKLLFLTGHYPSAFGVDRTEGANPIRQELNNLNNAGSLYGSIIYNKAPIMMRQLEALMGEEAFRKGIVKYMATYAYDNADWNELISILNEDSPLDLVAWSEVWVNNPGRPVFTSSVTYTADKIASFEIQQHAEDGSEKLWPQMFEVTLHYADSTKSFPVRFTGKTLAIDESIGYNKPNYITYNSDGIGYGIFPLENEMLGLIPYEESVVNRAQQYINLYENTLDGNILLDDAYQTYLVGVQIEKNEFVLRLISNYLRNLYWMYTSSDERSMKLPDLESKLYARLKGNETANIKKTLFNLYSGIAYEGDGLERLYSIWHKDLRIPNLSLNKDDYTDLAMRLALYGYSKSEEVLKAEEDAISDANKKERFRFLLPALSNDPNERATFFKSFAEERNRDKERWVTTACSYIHHPLRQATGINDIAISLQLLEEIQATGDIFFPKNWLDSTIGQYTSSEAMQVVNDYLESHKDLDPKLRAKVLQSVDDMKRKLHLVSTKINE